MVESFWLEAVESLESQGVPYTGQRRKWWYSTLAGWLFGSLDDFEADLERTLKKNAELYRRLSCQSHINE
jgi:hypothetical protein